MITLDVEYLTYDRLVKKLYFTLISGLWFILALFFSNCIFLLILPGLVVTLIGLLCARLTNLGGRGLVVSVFP